jgi:Protein of unknown function (DUF2490)
MSLRLLFLQIFFFLFFIPFPNFSIAQNIDNQFWIDYNLRLDLSLRSAIGGDIGVRGLATNQEWNQIYIRPAYTYRFKRILALSGGMALFSTFNSDTLNVFEYRPHLDILARFPDNEYIALFYRLRIEQRFFFFEDLANSQNFRIRYLIGIESPDITVFGEKRPFYFQAFWEGFKNLYEERINEVFVNQTRITFIFSHRVSAFFRYEINYVAQRSRLFSETGLETSQRIFRVRLFYRIFQME